MKKSMLVKIFTVIMSICVVLSQMGTYAMAYDGRMQKQPAIGQPDKDSIHGYTVSDETGNDASPEEPDNKDNIDYPDDLDHPDDSAPPESGQPSDEGAGDDQTQGPDDDKEAQPDDDEEALPDDEEETLSNDDKKIYPYGDAAYAGFPMHIYAGMQYSLVLNEDGSVWAWGCGESGQLGNGTAADSPVPVRVAVPGDVYTVSAGYTGSLAVTNDNSVYGWGNAQPQAGEEVPGDGLLPAEIPGLPDISGIFAGKEDNLAICPEGKVILWQKDIEENMEEDSLPKEVPGLSDIRYAVTRNGLVFAVDYQDDAWVCANTHNQENVTPRKLMQDVKTVSAAGDTIYILKNDGTVWSRGMEDILSDGEDHELRQMEDVDHAVSIAVQDDYGLVLKSDGTVWMWGGNEYVRPAVMEPEDESGLGQVMKLDNIGEIAAGPTHCLALGKDGSVWGWGDNSHGAVGDFPDGLITEPVLIIPGQGGLLAGDISLSISENNTYYLPVEGKGIASFEGRSFRISYDPTALKLIDFAVQLSGRYASAGSAGNELFIESYEDGEIIFTCNKLIPADREWSGLITLLLFEGLNECETRVSIAEEGPDGITEREPGEDAEEEPEDGTEQAPEDGTEQEPEDEKEEDPGDGTEQEPEDGTEQEPGDDTEQEPEDDTEQELENDAVSMYLNKEQYILLSKYVKAKSPKYSVMA